MHLSITIAPSSKGKSSNGRHLWRRSGVTWCFVGLALVIEKALIDPRLLKNAIPLFVILAIWFVAYFVIRKRQAEKLKREIGDLNALVK